MSIPHSRRKEKSSPTRIALPCSTTQRPTCAQMTRIVTMDGPDQALFLAAAGLADRHSRELMVHFGVLGTFKSHRW